VTKVEEESLETKDAEQESLETQERGMREWRLGGQSESARVGQLTISRKGISVFLCYKLVLPLIFVSGR